MDSFVSWLDSPFNPRRISKTIRRKARCVTIRYRGSFARSAIKTLIVLMLLAVTPSVIGERTSTHRDSGEAAFEIGSAGTLR